MPSNEAAWLTAAPARPMKVGSAPYTSPGKNQMVVKNGAVAVNPIDGYKQILGDKLFPWIKYPFIMGGDLAGEVVELGTGVTRFQVGDRVMAFGVGIEESANNSAESAFQLYTVVRANMASPIPSTLSYESACVLPLCLSTAACALFQKDYLGLPYPSLAPKTNGKTVLVWGGSSSVGSNAIQLAVAAGCEVVTTASPKNFDYVTRLGAIKVFDYRSTTVVQDIIDEFRNRQCAGALAIGNGSLKACIEVLAASKGSNFIAQVSVEVPDKIPSSTIGWIRTGMSMGWFSVSMSIKSKVKGVNVKYVSSDELPANEVSHVIYEAYIPTALAEGKYIPAPESMIVGTGLKYVQEAVDINMKGVSAKKVVISL